MGQPHSEANREPTDIFARLDGKTAVDRERIAQALRHLKPEQIDTLVLSLIMEQRRLTLQWNRHLLFLLPAYTILLLGTLVIGPIPFSVLFVLLLLDYARIRRQLRPVLNALTSIEDLRVVGPLLDLLEEGYRTDQAVISTLKRLLPLFRASDAGLLNAEQRRRLRIALKYSTWDQTHFDYVHHDLAVAILKALEQIGDSQDLPLVSALAAGMTWHSRPYRINSLSIQNAARACLPFLQARSAQEQAGATLLRPSMSSAVAPDALLRPALETGDVASDQLLRSSIPETDR